MLRALYAPFMRTSDRILVMDRRSAELTKYAANAMLATRISFMNELASLCERVGADIEQVRKGIGSDARIGPKFLFAGPGFGGSLLPEGPARRWSAPAREVGVRPVDRSTPSIAVNERQKRVLGDKVLAHFGGDLNGKRIAVWGLAFKPETDDIREAPALVLIDQLLAGGRDGRAATIRRRWRTCASSSAIAIELRRVELRVRQGRRRAGAGHRVARVPAPDFERLKR